MYLNILNINHFKIRQLLERRFKIYRQCHSISLVLLYTILFIFRAYLTAAEQETSVHRVLGTSSSPFHASILFVMISSTFDSYITRRLNTFCSYFRRNVGQFGQFEAKFAFIQK